jgi:hypothetical protein
MGFLDDLAAEKRNQEAKRLQFKSVLERELKDYRRTLEQLLTEVANNTWGENYLFSKKWGFYDWGRGIDLDQGCFFVEAWGKVFQGWVDGSMKREFRLIYEAFGIIIYVNDRGEHSRVFVHHKDGFTECPASLADLKGALRTAFTTGPYYANRVLNSYIPT